MTAIGDGFRRRECSGEETTPFLPFAICRLRSPLRCELRLATAHSGTASSPRRVISRLSERG